MSAMVIIGASGHGKVVVDIALLVGYDDVCFLDDDESLKECAGFPVIGTSQDVARFDADAEFFVAVGNAEIRKRLMDELDDAGMRIATLVHPGACISRRVEIGEGSVVMAGAVINSDAVIGRGSIVNTGATVDHDCAIGEYVHVSVGANVAGTVYVGDKTWIGAGAVINNNLHVCGGCTIGSGAVVVRDIDKPGTYVGVPARVVG